MGRRLAVAVVALVVLGVATGCVAPPSDPEVDTSAIDAPVEVDPGLYTVRIRSQTCEGLGVGSGFLIDSTTIVTNRHVVEGAETLEVETSEGVDLTVEVANQGLLADLAVVRLDASSSMEEVMGEDAPHATLAPVNPEPGDDIRAFGYPEGGVLTVTEGEVEDYVADPQLGNLSKVIRSEVEIHPGNSGGPAINERNEVVGVVYAIEVATEKSLIVPVDTLQRLLENDEGVETVQGC
ncbi:trypsin-like peptidase domain-containing protein [Iamia sp. SCSIO 61187]|uniref:S1C family serine protease n=1 Tax=Iamia sp. SCSIO 61187 TaxID=2722752 RepID=UPI001C6359B0|nr:serine protease [Iamia sp. SCSIO 61187]QYG94940.1 trypsin-like peptidase domain-containing protein [Iamia sp. SCSIO 61187]